MGPRNHQAVHVGTALVFQVYGLQGHRGATSNPTGDRYSCRDHALHRHSEGRIQVPSWQGI